jgi:hypothetical protein
LSAENATNAGHEASKPAAGRQPALHPSITAFTGAARTPSLATVALALAGGVEALGAAELDGAGSTLFPQPEAQIMSASAPRSILVVIVRIGFRGMVGAGDAIVKGA